MVAERTTEAKSSSPGSGSAVLYLIGSILQGLGLLLIQPFAIRLLSAAEWGLVSTSVVAIQVVVVLISAGLPLAITRLWFDPDRGTLRARGMYGFLAGGAGSLGILVAAVIAVAGPWTGGAVEWPAVLAMVSIGLLGTVLGAQAVLRAQNRPVAFVVLSLVSSVAANLAGLGAILFTTATAAVYLAAYTVAVAVAAALALTFVRPKAPWRVAGVTRESVAIAVPLLPHTGALMLLTQGAVLLLAALAGAVPAGQFGAVLIFALGPLTLLNALNNAWATRLMEAAEAKLPALLRSVAVEAFVAAAVIGALASAAATAGAFVLTQSPGELGPVARVLPLVSSGYALFLVATNMVYILQRTSTMAYLTPVVLVIMAAAATPFALQGNLLAVAAVQAGGFVLLGVVYVRSVKKFSPGAWPLRLFAVLTIGHLALVFILGLLPDTFLMGIAEIGVVGVVLAGLAATLLRNRRRAEHTPTST